MAQATKTEAPLVPKLRFKEFVGDGEWEKEKFSTLYIFETTNSLSRENLNYLSGTVKNVHYGDIHTKFSAHFDISKEKVPYINDDTLLEKINKSNYCAVGDLIFADASEDLKDIGKCIEIINLNNENLLSGLHTLLARPNSNTFIIGFCGHLFQSAYIRTQIQNEAQGTKILGLSSGRLSKIQVCYPQMKKGQRISEQQRIADCLTSLDENITAESQKLEALSVHKKALMQKLFPAEGEKVPALRFKEFTGTGEWEEKQLADVADKKIKWSFVGGPFGSNLKHSDYTEQGIRIIQLQNIGDADFIDTYKIYTSTQKADELLSCNIYPGDIILSKMGDPVGRACIIPTQDKRYLMCSDGIRLVVNERKYNKKFIYLTINSNTFRGLLEKTATGSTRKRIGLDELRKLPLYVPHLSEQQRIADCLTSLDEYITAQGRKIALLKEHKKGLMQQLFPRMEEENV